MTGGVVDALAATVGGGGVAHGLFRRGEKVQTQRHQLPKPVELLQRFPLIGQGVNLGGEPAARAADRMIVGLIGGFLVIRQSPL